MVLGAFDRGGLAALGYPVLVLDVVLLLVIEATVVTSIPAVGTILAVALIVAPRHGLLARTTSAAPGPTPAG